MDNTKSLTKLWKFWLSIGIPVIASVISFVAIKSNNNIVRDLSVSGFNNVFELFKVPIALLSLVFPAVALIAAIHRSEQTAQQLVHTKLQIDKLAEQHALSNFYEHRKQFLEVLSELESSHRIKFTEKSRIYRELFPSNNIKKLDFKGDEAFLTPKLEALRKQYEASVKNLTLKNVYMAYRVMSDVARKLSIEADKPIKISFFPNESKSMPTLVRYSTENVYEYAYILGNVIEELATFAFVEVKVPELVNHHEFDKFAKELLEKHSENAFDGWL